MIQISLLIAIFIFLQLSIVKAASTGCKQVSISTRQNEDGEMAYDAMNRGVVSAYWQEDVEQHKDSDSTELDFLYVTVYGKHDPLTISSFKIDTNSTFSSNTTLFIEKVVTAPDSSYRIYSIRVNYKCNEDLAKPIKLDFKVEGNFPGCKGSNSFIYWTRTCGDNEPPRMGLSLIYNVKQKKNFTVVEDGRLIDADYFSESYDTYVLRIPKKVDYAIFYLSLNRSEEIFTHNEMTIEDMDKLFDKPEKEVNELLTHQLQFSKEQIISKVTTNYDVEVLDATVRGTLKNGGVVDFDPQMIYVSFQCIRGGITGVQLSIEMAVFKNINVFFEKECPMTSKDDGFEFWSAINTLFYLILSGLVLTTLYNIFVLEQKVIQAIPFATTTLTAISNLSIIKNSSFGRGLFSLGNPSYVDVSKPDNTAVTQDQALQNQSTFTVSEFKIKNISDDSYSEDYNSSEDQPISKTDNYGSI